MLVTLASLSLFIPDQPGPMTLLAAVGGLSLLLGGMSVLGGGLRRLSGGRARRALEGLTGNPLSGAVVGFAVTAIIHSSGATALMLVSLVETGLLNLSAAIPVILGATVGTTLTGQLLAFRIDWLIPVTLALGLAIKLVPRKETYRAVGDAIYGMGLLFLGLAILSSALAPLKTTASFTEIFLWIQSRPAAGLPIGILVTVILQSSTASTGILIGLASQGLMPLDGAVFFLLGAHIGSCSTGLIATAGTGPKARRVAVVQLLAACAGLLLFAFWVPGVSALVRWFSFSGRGTDGLGATAREVANAHTLLSAVPTLVLLPFSHWLEKAASWIIRDGNGRPRLFYLDRSLLRGPVGSPDMALAQARLAVKEMAAQAAMLVERAVRPAHETSEETLDDLLRRTRQIHELRSDLVGFLTDIGRADLRLAEADQGLDLALVATELDAITQRTEEALALCQEQDEVGPFSPAGQKELDRYRDRMLALLRRASAAFLSGDRQTARDVEREKEELSRQEETLRRAHLERLRSGIAQSARTDALHLAWLELMRQVNSHSKRIARVLLERPAPPAKPVTEPKEKRPRH